MTSEGGGLRFSVTPLDSQPIQLAATLGEGYRSAFLCVVMGSFEGKERQLGYTPAAADQTSSWGAPGWVGTKSILTFPLGCVRTKPN